MSQAERNRFSGGVRPGVCGEARARGFVSAFRLLIGRDGGRGGATAAEFALVLPVLLAFVLGIIEFSWMYFVENEMSYAARSVSRDVSVGTYTVGEAEGEVLNRLSHFGYPFIANANQLGNEVTIDVSVPTQNAALFNFLSVFVGGTIDISVTMQLEP